MKIKTNKKMRLDELIKYVWENGISNSTFIGVYGASWTKIFVNHHGVISVNNVSPLSVFEISAEEELTEETVISGMTGVYYNRQRNELDLTVMQRTAIKNQLGDDVEDILLAIYVGPTLIWSSDSGIPADGVLEVLE